MIKKTTLLVAALLAASLAHADGSFVTVPFLAANMSGNGQFVTGPNAAQTETLIWSAATGLTTSMGAGTFGGNAAVQPVSFDGTRIGNTVKGADNVDHAAYYNTTTGQFTQMAGGLGGTAASGGKDGVVFAISGDGAFLGGYGLSVGGSGQGFLNATIWNTSTGQATRLGATGTFSRVNGLSNDGKVAVGRFNSASGAVWSDLDGDGVYTQLIVAGAPIFNSVSSNGQWAVGGSVVYNITTQQLTSIPRLNPTWSMAANDVSADGSLVVGYETSSTGVRQGFIWEAGVGTLSMDTYLANHGVDVANSFEFRVPAAISDDGLTFSGYGTINGGNGNNIGFVANITAVPEPSSYAMLMAGLGAMGFLVRRRRSAA